MRTRLGLAVLCLAGLTLLAPARGTAPAREETRAGVTIEAGKTQLEFRAGKALVGRYIIKQEAAKPYFWPLCVPGGDIVTRGWPMTPPQPGEQTDHPHQKSAWFCHGDVIPEGLALRERVKGVTGVDFWAEGPGRGKIVCTAVAKPKEEKGHASVATRNEWRTADGTRILDEARTIHLYDLDGAYLLVLDIDLHASVCPITFGDTKEGAMGVRVRTALTEKPGKGILTNAEGKEHEKNVWGRRSAWCDYSGPVSRRETGGITIFDDPSNLPACWHSRGYGLMAANPFARARSGFPGARDRTQLVKLARGEHLKLRYGILLHNGDVKEGKVAEIYQRFVKLKG